MIAPDISKSLSDVTFGMLLMSQLACAMALHSKGRRHNLQLMMFRFMLYLIFVSIFEFVYFYLVCPVHSVMTCPLTDILEMSIVPCALLIIIRLTSPLTRQWKLIIPNAVAYYGAFFIFCFTWNMTLYKVMLGFTIIYAIGIIVYGVVAVNKFNRRLKMNFSDESLSLYWLKYIMIIYILLLIVWTSATIYISDGVISVYNILVMTLLSLFCYFVYRQEDMLCALVTINAEAGDETAGDVATDDTLSTDAEGSATAQPHNYKFEERFRKAFEDDRIYLRPELNIVELSMAVGTNRTYISNYLNQQLHTPFYEYVNSWRVGRAKDLLTTTDMPLEDVATESGFNSMSSFRRYFTASTGKTPGAYRRENSEQKDS